MGAPFLIPAQAVTLFRATAAEWTAIDPILMPNQLAYETDTKRAKWGDGSTAYSSLEYWQSFEPLVQPGYALNSTAVVDQQLNVASPGTQRYTSLAAGNNVLMPVVTTLPQTGTGWYFINDTAGNITVASSGGNAIATIPAGGRALITCILLTGTTAASWATTLWSGAADIITGTIDCSANPNYPAATEGQLYMVSVAGKIGGGSGVDVEAGDMALCIATNAGGTQAAVGSSWNILQTNLTAAQMAAIIHGATSKATPVDDDEIPLADSAASFGLKKLTWANLKATLATWLGYTAASASGPSSFDFYEDTDNGTNKLRLKAPSAVTADGALELPDVTAGTLALVSPVIREITAATDTITQADNGKIVRANRATGQTLTVTGPISAGFNCMVIQEDAGQTTFAAGGGATLVNRQTHTKIAGEGGVASLVCAVADTVYLAGDTAA